MGGSAKRDHWAQDDVVLVRDESRAADPQWERVHEPSELDLFLFSSAVRVSHRIHYDAEFAKNDGHADVVVHATLQAAWLTELAEDYARTVGAELLNFRYETRSSSIAGDHLSTKIDQVENPDPDGVTRLYLSVINERTGLAATSAVAQVKTK
jgi:hydroxyacyl-ACP dehydratase HTD2-like protein with hotdog domain